LDVAFTRLRSEGQAAEIARRPQLLYLIGPHIVAASGHKQKSSGDAGEAVREVDSFN
jgi:hypothetical protein